MKRYDYIIVGSGLFGATFNYLAKTAGKTCLIVERRNHIGGNLYSPIVDGIPIHQYGAHIFHTHDKSIWDFVCNNCEMVPFINSPIARYKNEIYNLPFNMNTFSKLFNIATPEEAKQCIENEIKESGITEPTNLEEQAISLVGRTIYEKLIKEYTEKQWGRDCKELDKDIIKRLPVRFSYDNNYFNDLYQGIPKGGYNTLINNLIGDTEVVFDDYLKNKEHYDELGNVIIYTGPIDEYFNYSEGQLEWRKVDFVTKTYNVQNYQGNAVVNYTSHDKPYTRVIEHKFFDRTGEGFNNAVTHVSEEYSSEWKPGQEPYYPVNNDRNTELLKKYQEMSKSYDNVVFGGRLGTYKYYDMDDTIISAMELYNKISKSDE
jgi:UDP-galactopyranose mutase